MSDIKIDSLQIEAKTNLKDAISDIDKLKESLSKLGDGKSAIDSYSTAINGLTKKLTSFVGISDKNGIASVKKSISELGKAALKLNDMMRLDPTGAKNLFSQDKWDDAFNNVNSAMERVKYAIAEGMNMTKPLSDTDKAFDNYIRKAGKVHIPVEVKAEYKTDNEYAKMRSVLGKGFSSAGGGIDFSKFIEEMNSAIGTTFDTSKNAADLFADVVNSLREIRQESAMTAQDVLKDIDFPLEEIESELARFAAIKVPDIGNKGLSEMDAYAADSDTGDESIKEVASAVTTAVKGKTKAFEQEQKTVTNVVNAEMKDLINLRTTVESVTKAVGGENGLSEAFKKLSTSGLSELAALKDIDFSGIAKLNEKNLGALTGKKQQYTGLTDTEKALINEAAEKATAPESVPWLEDYLSLLQKARDEAQKDFGTFETPDNVEELQEEFAAVSSEVIRLKENIQEALRTLDTDGVNEMVEELSLMLAEFHDLNVAAATLGVVLQEPSHDWQPSVPIPQELFEQETPQIETPQIEQELSSTSEATARLQDSLSKVNTDATQAQSVFASLKSNATAAMEKIASSIRNVTFKDIVNGAAKIKSGISIAAKAISSFASKAKSAIKTVTSIGASLASVGKGFTSFSGKILNFGSGNSALFHPFSKGAESLSNFNDKLNYGLKKALQYGFGIRSLFVLFNKLRSVIQDGMDSLVMYSDNANNSISLLKSDLSYVGNSLAAAFEPILNTIAPIIDQVVDYLVMGINAINAFFAALTGKSTYTVAVKNITSYRDSLSDASSAGDDAADATDGLKDSAEDLKRELMGFDEIEKLSEDLDNAANSGSGGNGGNGGSGGSSSGSGDPISFTEKSIPGATSDFADLVKEAWANADFTEIGNIVGTKLKEALDSIDWGPIQEQAKKIAKCTATFINGFFETEGLDDSVGRTIGEALNTAIGAITTFVDTTHWDSIGEFMSGGLRSAIATVDWTGLGQVLNAKYKALWGFLDGFVVDMSTISFEGTTGWQEAGNAIAETINSIFAQRDYSAVAATISSGINGIVSTLDTAINGIDFKGMSTNFANGINRLFTGINWLDLANMVSNGLNTATASLLNFSVTVDWANIGSSIASSANQLLAKTDFSQAGAALGSAFKGALSSLNNFAATFDWYNLGTQIRDFIIGIDWGGLLLTAAETIVHTFFGLFEAAWGLVFGGGEKSEYAQIASDLSDAISGLEVDWPTIEDDAIENFNNVSEIVDKFLDLNDKLKKNGSLSETDTTLFENYYNQIVEYAPEAASLIGEVGTAYEGTDEALRQLIEDQKNLAIQEGFKEAMSNAAKNYADAQVALEGVISEISTSLKSPEEYQALFNAWAADESNSGKLEDFTADLNEFFDALRSGTVDIENATGATGRIAEAMTRSNNEALDQIKTTNKLVISVQNAKNTLDQITTAQEEWNKRTQAHTESLKSQTSALEATKTLTEQQKKAVEGLNDAYGIWKNSVNTTGVEKLQTLFGSITNALSGAGGTGKNLLGGLNETLSLDVDLKASGLDTSKLTTRDKVVEGGTLYSKALITQTESHLTAKEQKIDMTAQLTKAIDSLKKSSKVIEATGEFSQIKDSLSKTLKTFSTIAKFDDIKDALTSKEKTINTTSNYSSSKDSLTSGQKTITTKANFTSKSDASLNKTINTKANFTTKSDSSLNKTIDTKANFTTKSDTSLNKTIDTKANFVTRLISGMSTVFDSRANFNSRNDSSLNKVFNSTANFTNRNESGLNKVFSTVANFTSSRDSISNRTIGGLTGLISAVARAGWLSVDGVFGYVSSVARQSGVSLVLAGITGVISAISSVFRRAEGGAYYGGMWHSIPQYASGTLNAGSMFIAGEAGPELVGHVGGRTEVLNQSQLAAVMESAVAAGMAQASSNGGGGNVTVNVVLQGDAKKIFEVVKKENNSRVMQTGRAQLLT